MIKMRKPSKEELEHAMARMEQEALSTIEHDAVLWARYLWYPYLDSDKVNLLRQGVIDKIVAWEVSKRENP